MISPTLDSLRIFLHVLAVAIWVGGQIVLAGVVPALRRETPSALPNIARGFARLAWPAMFVIIATGIWSLNSINATDQDSSYLVTFAIKMLVVGVAIAATVVHSLGHTKVAKAVGGALGLLASLFAMYLGTLMTHAA